MAKVDDEADAYTKAVADEAPAEEAKAATASSLTSDPPTANGGDGAKSPQESAEGEKVATNPDADGDGSKEASKATTDATDVAEGMAPPRDLPKETDGVGVTVAKVAASSRGPSGGADDPPDCHAAAATTNFIDLAASSEDDSSKKNQLATASEPESTQTSPVPEMAGKGPDPHEGDIPMESAPGAVPSPAKPAEKPDPPPVPLGEPETTRTTSDTISSGGQEISGTAEPAAIVETQGATCTTEDGIVAVENGEMEIDVTPTAADTGGSGTPTTEGVGAVTKAASSEAPNALNTGKGAGQAETEPPSRMDIDSGTEIDPEAPTDTGGAEGKSEMEVDTEKVASSLSANVEADAGVQVSGTDGKAIVSSDVLAKRSSPDQTAVQPPAKRAKEGPPPQSGIAETEPSQPNAPDASTSFETAAVGKTKANDPTSNTDEVESVPAPNENGQPSASEASDHPPCDPVFASLVDLSPIPDIEPLPLLSPRDIAELESALQIGDKYNNSDDNQWRDDWSGNVHLLDKELLMNRGQIAQDPQTKPVLLPFVEWVSKTTNDPAGFRGVHLLFSYVFHMKGTPPMAQKIMAFVMQRPAKTVATRLKFILDGMRRIYYDPTVLNEDGWTTAKSQSPDGVTGGAFLIGQRVIWHRYEAIVIAFVHDDEIGDLWKGIWLEDLDTFDMEADELQEALKKWNRKDQLKQKKLANRQSLLGGTVRPQGFAGREKVQSTSQRFAASSNFTIEGIEHGLILATSFNQQARLGVPWPARVMNVSEVKAIGAQSSRSRSSSKNLIHIVFLAPYWNGQYAFSSKKSGPVSSKAATAKDPFSTGPLFEMDTIEVSESTIKKYPFDVDDGTLSIDALRTNFRFLGLPKLAFNRYLAAHRLAWAFKSYAVKEISKNPASSNQAQTGAVSALTDAHTLSVRAHMFPQASLDLPFDFILSKLPCPVEQAAQLADETEEVTEPVINLHAILKALSPPRCFGLEAAEVGQNGESPETPQSERGLTPCKSPDPKFSSTPASAEGQDADADSLWSVSNFASDYLLKVIGSGNDGSAAKLPYLGKQFAELVGSMRRETEAMKALAIEARKERLEVILKQCLVVKGHGEDIIHSNKASDGLNIRNVVLEWRKACERVYKRVSVKFSRPGFGDGVTFVITDSRCNQHITANGSFERAVRLPAAIKGARNAGAGKKETMPLLYTVDSKYVDLAEHQIIPKAHTAKYLTRLKAKIANLSPDAKGMPLTDDSEGEGGEDTMGSRGSYTAAVLGVAAALEGVDKIVGGQCVNVFCAIRPPGHHAGRDLRPMHAISNGFCLLNAAACAALYATAPQAEGGLGLKRVCVIDFDVHHGNGTQDILCSTQDSRFLYVSIHAGGAHINGYDGQGESEDGHHGLGGGKHDGIFPGRCGDTSPHEGVLNIPVGQKVTAAAVGNALVTKVSPAVERFCPELIILSAGFDAHKHDPLGMGGLSAEDFGSVTEVACQMAFKTCSGRVISVLEGGYGVPCCRPPSDSFLPDNLKNTAGAPKAVPPVRLLDLGDDLPNSMEDPVTPHLQQKLERCHQEGFVECVQAHVGSLSKCNRRARQ